MSVRWIFRELAYSLSMIGLILPGISSAFSFLTNLPIRVYLYLNSYKLMFTSTMIGQYNNIRMSMHICAAGNHIQSIAFILADNTYAVSGDS